MERHEGRIEVTRVNIFLCVACIKFVEIVALWTPKMTTGRSGEQQSWVRELQRFADNFRPSCKPEDCMWNTCQHPSIGLLARTIHDLVPYYVHSQEYDSRY